MKISFPKKDGPKKGRKAPWQLNLAHGGKTCRKYFRTRDLRVEAKTAMTQTLHHGTFAEDYPAEARKLGFSEQEQGAIRLQAAFDLFMKDAEKRKIANATISTWRQQIGKFGRDMENPAVEKVTRQMVTAYIESYRTEASRTSVKNALVNFLSWCGEDGQGFCPRAHFHGLTWRRIRGAKPKPTFLSVDDCGAHPGQVGIDVAVPQHKKSRFESFEDRMEAGLMREWHENGRLAYEGYQKEGKGHGGYRRYYKSGSKMFEGTYRDGNIVADRGWKPDGSASPTKVIEGNGVCFEYFENGNLLRKEVYLNGLLHNLCEQWYDNGNLYRGVSYFNGLKNGA